MMNDSNRNNRTRISALALSAALTMAAAIGLTSASEHQARTEAQSLCGVAPTDKGLPSIPPGVPNDDPELIRIDRANDHHG